MAASGGFGRDTVQYNEFMAKCQAAAQWTGFSDVFMNEVSIVKMDITGTGEALSSRFLKRIASLTVQVQLTQ